MSSEKVNKYIRMLEDPDHRMRAIQKIEALGDEARAAVPDLWNIVKDQNGEPSVRAAALKAIVTIDGPNGENVAGLLERLDKDKERSLDIALQAAQFLEGFGTSVSRELPKLWKYLNDERDRPLRSALARAIIRIDGNEDKLFEQAMRTIQNLDQQWLAMTAILSELELSKAKTNKALGVLWEIIGQNPPTEIVDPIFLAIVDITADDEMVLERLLNDDRLNNQTRVFAIIEPKLWNNVRDAFKASSKASSNPRLLAAMLGALRLEEKDVDNESPRSDWDKLDVIRRSVIDLLKEGVFDEDVLSEVITAVEMCLAETGLGLGLIYRYKNFDRNVVMQWLKSHPKPFPGIGEFLLFEADDNLWDEQWENDPVTTLWHVIAVITQSNLTSWQSTHAYQVVDRLNGKRSEISRELCEQVNIVLIDAKEKAAKDSLREYLVDQVLDIMRKRLNQLYKKDIIKDIQEDQDEGSRIKKIRQLIQGESPEALRELIDVWIKWVVNNNHPAVFETTAILIRESPIAVAPLVDQLTKSMPLDAQIRDLVLDEIGSQNSLLREFLVMLLQSETQEEQMSPAVERSMQEWLEGFENRSGEFSELFQTAKERKWSTRQRAIQLIGLLEKQKHREREQLRYRRITQQLANMSDPRFFRDAELHKPILTELIKHAVPTLARQLPIETDIVAREHLARALANLSGREGGREAVDALVRAVVDEEKKRAARQDLLAKYYLEPSKQQSDDAAKLLSGAVADAKNTLKILQNLNITVVVVGMVLLVAGVLTSLLSKDLSARLVGGLAGIGGLAGVIIQLINNPLDRIQNAMANLVQIETAFTSFIWELNLNGTYIQSQYVAEGILTNDEIAQTVNRIESAMSLAMNLVAVYTEEGRQRVVTRINSLSPAAGEVGAQLVIHGYHLHGDNGRKKKERVGTVVINHKPIDIKNLSWGENEVKFIVPPELPGLEENSGTVWISLLIDGIETNALPFHVTN